MFAARSSPSTYPTKTKYIDGDVIPMPPKSTKGGADYVIPPVFVTSQNIDNIVAVIDLSQIHIIHNYNYK